MFNKVEEDKFTYAEVELLGIVALEEFQNFYGVNVTNFKFSDLRSLYRDVITNPLKYKKFAEWLYPRFEKFIVWNIPMRIYVGNKKFILRGDDQLENGLKNTLNNIKEYIHTGITSSKRISILFYYLNLMFK